MKTTKIKPLYGPDCEWNNYHVLLNSLCKLALLQVHPKQFRLDSVEVKVKKTPT